MTYCVRHQARCRPGVPVRLAHQRRPRPDQHLPQDDRLRAAGRPLHGACCRPATCRSRSRCARSCRSRSSTNGERAADHDLERHQHVRRRARARRRGAPRLRPGRRGAKNAGLDFNASMIFGGQISGEAMRLFLVYSAGNFIEATRETLLLPDRRVEVRQAGARPHDHARRRRSTRPPSARWCRWTRR